MTLLIFQIVKEPFLSGSYQNRQHPFFKKELATQVFLKNSVSKRFIMVGDILELPPDTA